MFYDTAILRAKGYQKLWPSNTIAPFWIPMEEGKGHEFYYDTAILEPKATKKCWPGNPPALSWTPGEGGGKGK